MKGARSRSHPAHLIAEEVAPHVEGALGNGAPSTPQGPGAKHDLPLFDRLHFQLWLRLHGLGNEVTQDPNENHHQRQRQQDPVPDLRVKL